MGGAFGNHMATIAWNMGMGPYPEDTQQQKTTNRNMEQTEKKKDEIVLPTEPRKAPSTNPKTLLISGKHKEGKTSSVAQLPNCLILDLEKGADFVDGIVLSPPDGIGPVSAFKWLKEVAKKIKDEGRPYDYVAIDTLSQIDIWAEWEGTWSYMHTVQGKNFNRDVNGVILRPDNINYQSVITLPQGAGWYHVRTALLEMYETLKDLGKICTIFICHVADKMISEKQGEQVMVKDLALTGKCRDIIPRLVDAIGTVWNEDGKLMISFNGNHDKIGGVRCKHLAGYSGPLEWSRIFIDTI